MAPGRDMTRTVLVPMDGSPLSVRALRHALSTFPDADVTVLHVIDLFEPTYATSPDAGSAYEPMMGTEAWYQRAEEASAQLFEEAREVAEDYDRAVETTSDIGDPERIIADYVDEEAADHVVLGAHGRQDEDRAVFGSVAETVARRATVPVTIIR